MLRAFVIKTLSCASLVFLNEPLDYIVHSCFNTLSRNFGHSKYGKRLIKGRKRSYPSDIVFIIRKKVGRPKGLAVHLWSPTLTRKTV